MSQKRRVGQRQRRPIVTGSPRPDRRGIGSRGNFESFLLHRVIFVRAAILLLFQPRAALLSLSDNAPLPPSCPFTPLWLPKWNNFFNSGIYRASCGLIARPEVQKIIHSQVIASRRDLFLQPQNHSPQT